MDGWTAQEDRYMAEYRGESIDDAPTGACARGRHDTCPHDTRDLGDGSVIQCGCACHRAADPDPDRCEVCGEPLAHVGPEEWECLACLDAEVAERDAQRLVDEAAQEAASTADDPPEARAVLDFNLAGEDILVRRIAAALSQARRAA